MFLFFFLDFILLLFFLFFNFTILYWFYNTYLAFRFCLLWQPPLYLFSLNVCCHCWCIRVNFFCLTLCFLFCCVLPLFVWVSYFLSDLLLSPNPHPNLSILLSSSFHSTMFFFLDRTIPGQGNGDWSCPLHWKHGAVTTGRPGVPSVHSVLTVAAGVCTLTYKV